MKVNKIEGILLERNKKFGVAEGDRLPVLNSRPGGWAGIPQGFR